MGISAVKWVAGAGAATLVGGAVVLSLVGGESARSEEPEEPESFYLEATAHLADPEHPTDLEFRWWHQDPGHAKWPYDLVNPAIQTLRRTSVQDGTTLYSYSPDNGPLSIENGWSNGTRLPRPKDVILIGPTEQKTVPELLTWLSSWGDGTKAAQVTGYERVGTRDTKVIEYVSGTIWVEPNEMLIVRHVSDRVDLRVTVFSRTDFDASLVRLPASVAARPTPTPWDAAKSRPIPPFGEVLVPTYQPWPTEGLASRYSCGDLDDCATEQILMSQEQFWANQATPGTPARAGEHILLQQRTGLATMPEPMRRGIPTTIRGVSGYITETPGLVVLDWQEPDGRLVHMEGVEVSREEVLKVAEGLELKAWN